jgi:hypothetical protein
VTGLLRRPPAAWLAGAALLALALWSGNALDRARGFAIYHGYTPVAGHIQGHGASLPPRAVVCAGCHEAAPVAQAGGAPFSTRLADLSRTRARRGGPASAYTAESFCRALREGVDPGAVMLDRLMPRFDLTAEQCGALWIYLGGG